jgi:phosphopantetheine--protein transferase-like protein
MSDYKAIIAAFLKIDPSQIGVHTIIDKSVLHGSIMLHRMHAKLAQAGCRIENWRDIRTYGDLERTVTGLGAPEGDVPDLLSVASDVLPLLDMKKPAIGVDIEEIATMPHADDYREHPFYRETFSQEEISHCILQSHPRESFAGLFSAKEAVLKAEGGKKLHALRGIEIFHDEDGKPFTSGYEISISHSGAYAVAVAMRISKTSDPQFSACQTHNAAMAPPQLDDSENVSKVHKVARLQYLALIVSFIALAMVFVQLTR